MVNVSAGEGTCRAPVVPPVEQKEVVRMPGTRFVGRERVGAEI